jgi:beta-lactamase regulating signal transducer with metallopeptidase domain
VSTHLLLEAALRSLVMGSIIFVALRLLRIEQVRARRTAWLLALAGALAMPLLVAAQIGPRLLPEIAFAHQPSVEALTVAPPTDRAGAPRAQVGADQYALGLDHGPSLEQPVYSAHDRGGADKSSANMGGPDDKSADGARLVDTALLMAVIGYCAVAATLALRLFAGVGFALRLKNQAERVVFPFDPDLDTRASARLATPVTVGSSVLLPKNHTLWDGATLRIVLSHERAHVRQKDFYVHMLAGLHCALFWFNPFSWWLQRQLSELGEALSDCAAVEQAESRASYAETLLAFATREHWPKTSVAMASASNLTPRIERLLNDQGFERSFEPKQRLPFIAAGVVLLAMVASTSMVRVHAAASKGTLNANTVETTNPTTTSTSTTTSTTTNATSVQGAAPADASTPATPAKKRIHKVRKEVVNVDVDPADAADIASDEETARAVEEADRVAQDAEREARNAERAARDADRASRDAARDSGREAEEAADEEVLAIRSGKSHITINSGRLMELQAPKGDYIYFQHNGKPYVIQDPQIIAKTEELLAPMKELGEKQKELGHRQAMLGAQQRTLVEQQRSIKIAESPEFKREMEELQKRLKDLDLPRLTAQIAAQIDERALADIQSHFGEIQARVGHLQAEFGHQDSKFGEQQGKLGEQQGRLGEQQALLGEQQRKIVEETRRQLKPLLEQAIRDGKGKALISE